MTAAATEAAAVNTGADTGPDTGPNSQARAVDVLARTIWGEARGESVRGKEAVAAVVMNRVRKARRRGRYWWGNDIEQVCTRPYQFSCWNTGDPNREKLLRIAADNKAFRTCLRIARRAVHGGLTDPTGGATHYHAQNANPPWARGRAASAEIGGHLFYNDIE